MRNVPRMLEEKRELIAAVMREKVFECTCALLREEGWRAFTMEKLAARMGVAKGTLYNYFRDKESVILFIRDQVSAHVAAELEAKMERTA
ncbi:MAG: TetR/AcrR family transcriptional regulator, partial [Pyramidobacter sp.]|nr:TetR/AcrR family transcriptional regulator [Pyramidobacter sp.]